MQEQYDQSEIDEAARRMAREYLKVPPVEFFAAGPIQIPKTETASVLRIGPHGEHEVLRVETPAPMPHAWHRFWYWFLLGWKWERP